LAFEQKPQDQRPKRQIIVDDVLSVPSIATSISQLVGSLPYYFMVQLTLEEFNALKSQNVTSSWGGLRRALPYAFREHGILMLSSVLRSRRASQWRSLTAESVRKFQPVVAPGNPGYQVGLDFLST
jgi:ORF6N domain